MSGSIVLAESGFLPDFLTRLGIKRLLRARLENEREENSLDAMVDAMSRGPLAIKADAANEQHYEVPADFFALMLGERLKYSCAYYENGASDLNTAEQHMLSLTAARARIEDGLKILELGCGWGSLSLALAKHYPTSHITAVSNSHQQREFIEARATRLGVDNLHVITCDINDFTTTETYDRVVSIEMFEHLRNYKLLFNNISSWLTPGGKLFFHIFCHRDTPYFFNDNTESDWMARHFFSGGVMPSYDLPLRFTEDLKFISRWKVNGKNYAHTCDAWLKNLDARKAEAMSLLERGGNPDDARVQFHRWRMFVMACGELFAFNAGNAWFVGHYLLERA